MDNTPFREGTKLYQTFQVLADEDWHCGKHELPGTQPAKAIQVIRQYGYEIENKTVYCEICKENTVHRRLVSTGPSGLSIIRSRIPRALINRVKALYKNVEAVTQREYPPSQLEVDHRFPQVRWSKPEDAHNKNITDGEIIARFQLLTRSHNLWKSRYCEACVKTGNRGTFIGINYFYAGTAIWPDDVPFDDERGCHGCFWYDPETWRQSLNELISISNEGNELS